jgi:hypothetical protein
MRKKRFAGATVSYDKMSCTIRRRSIAGCSFECKELKYSKIEGRHFVSQRSLGSKISIVKEGNYSRVDANSIYSHG